MPRRLNIPTTIDRPSLASLPWRPLDRENLLWHPHLPQRPEDRDRIGVDVPGRRSAIEVQDADGQVLGLCIRGEAPGLSERPWVACQHGDILMDHDGQVVRTITFAGAATRLARHEDWTIRFLAGEFDPVDPEDQATLEGLVPSL